MKPDHIRRAVVRKDTDFLSAAGRKGGHATAQKRERQKILDERAKELREREESERAMAANEHVIPVFGLDAPDN